MANIDTSVAPRLYILCSTISDEVSHDGEFTPDEAERINTRFASMGFPWEWVEFSEKGESVA